MSQLNWILLIVLGVEIGFAAGLLAYDLALKKAIGRTQ